MINFNTGEIITNSNLYLYPNLRFEEFKKSKYYSNQNVERIICIKEMQEIEQEKWHVSLLFEQFILKKVFLMIDSLKIKTWEDEPKRKILHDEYLKNKGILNNAILAWGKISSDFDSKSCTSHVILSYTMNQMIKK